MHNVNYLPMSTTKKEFQGFNHGTGQIDLSSYKDLLELKPTEIHLKPTEIHLKEDGDLNDQPSLAIVMTNILGAAVVGQISLKMFNEGLADIGYEMKKIEK